MTDHNKPLSDILSEDVIEFILSGLTMSNLVKVGKINKYYLNLSEKNNLWENFYETLFNRSFIDKNSVHVGDVTWWRCKVGNYPGWSRIHHPIDNTNQCCRIRSHYENLSEKKPKIKYKNYKKMTMKRCKTIISSDYKIKTTSQDRTQLNYWIKKQEIAKTQINILTKKINTEKEVETHFSNSENYYKNLETKQKTKKRKKIKIISTQPTNSSPSTSTHTHQA